MAETIQMLREQADSLRRELRRRDVAEAVAKQEAVERERQAAQVARQLEREQARDAELEKSREGAWYNHLITAKISAGKGQEALNPHDLKVPASGWPPGDGPENYGSFGGDWTSAETPSGLATDTPMARALTEMLERQRMVREASP